jgi:hypothetical protein
MYIYKKIIKLILMGRSSEEFIKQREEELNSLPTIQAPLSWGFISNNINTEKNEEQNI